MAEEEDKEEDKEEALADRQYHEAQIAASVAVVATVGRCLHPELMATPGIGNTTHTHSSYQNENTAIWICRNRRFAWALYFVRCRMALSA